MNPTHLQHPRPDLGDNRSDPHCLYSRAQSHNLRLLAPLLPIRGLMPFPKNGSQIPRRAVKYDGADGDERSIFERGGQDAVFLREEEGGLELGGFGARLDADDSARGRKVH